MCLPRSECIIPTCICRINRVESIRPFIPHAAACGHTYDGAGRYITAHLTAVHTNAAHPPPRLAAHRESVAGAGALGLDRGGARLHVPKLHHAAQLPEAAAAEVGALGGRVVGRRRQLVHNNARAVPAGGALGATELGHEAVEGVPLAVVVGGDGLEGRAGGVAPV